MRYKKQVEKEIYDSQYESSERWASYATQIIESVKFLEHHGGNNILEVGVGSGTYSAILRSKGFHITTVDIDPSLKPDRVASITELPFPDENFDMAVAFEVLEHIKFSDFHQALLELVRVSKNGVIISIPNVYPYLSNQIKLPLIKTISIMGTVPIALKKDKFDGEHYWEIGRINYSKSKLLKAINSVPGVEILNNFRVSGCPFHHFFIIKKA